MAERTGCPVLLSLWSYVPGHFFFKYIYPLNFTDGLEDVGHSHCGDWSRIIHIAAKALGPTRFPSSIILVLLPRRIEVAGQQGLERL
jgi:hypothetical protein